MYILVDIQNIKSAFFKIVFLMKILKKKTSLIWSQFILPVYSLSVRQSVSSWERWLREFDLNSSYQNLSAAWYLCFHSYLDSVFLSDLNNMKEEKSAEYKNAIESLENFIMIKWANDTTIVPKVEIFRERNLSICFFSSNVLSDNNVPWHIMGIWEDRDYIMENKGLIFWAFR